MTAQIPPEIANAVIGLFSDPVQVTKLQEEYIKEKQEIQTELQNRQNQNNENKAQDNQIEDTVELQNQGQ